MTPQYYIFVGVPYVFLVDITKHHLNRIYMQDYSKIINCLPNDPTVQTRSKEEAGILKTFTILKCTLKRKSQD